MAITIICVMCMANANIHAALFAWAFGPCLMVMLVIVMCMVHKYILIYLTEYSLSVCCWFMMPVNVTAALFV